MSDIRGIRRGCAVKMKRIVRECKRAVAKWMVLTLVLLCFTGCRKETDDSLEALSLDENKTEEKHTGELQDQVEMSGSEETKEKEPELIFVYVCGAVQSPGVYRLASGARIYEAVALAGGMSEDAAEAYVNQAQVLSDGEQIYIPAKEEVEQGNAVMLPQADQSTGGTDHGKVNINTASEEELTTLTGIGDTRAKSIVEYREANGGFQTIEDLMKVEGIKEGVFKKIKDSITVNAGS